MAPPTENELETGPVKPGDLFEGYQILKLLGQGGYASVYHARREFIDSHVAIKISNRSVTREVFRRFQEEARLTRKLKHPNIVEVLDANVASSGHLFIVMELLLGQTFWDARKQYVKLTIPEALHLCAQAADGVQQAHLAGAIHRDLKPLNLFIVEPNGAKVLDFGIAKVVHDGDGSSTQRNVVHGTLKYMSPEQLLGEILTARSDIYALAVILFELITGRHPHLFRDALRTEAELGCAIVRGNVPKLDELDSTIPSYVVELVARALSRNPEERFASMAEFAKALRECYERYVQEFPEFAELRELWVPAPTISAVVRSTEPPSQKHIATAVVAVVPPQSLRPTVRVLEAPPQQSDLYSAPGAPAAAHRAPPAPIAPTPAPVTGGTALAARPAPAQKSAGHPQPATLRRIVPAGAAIGLILGVGVTLARLPALRSPKPGASAESASSRTVSQFPPTRVQPAASQSAGASQTAEPVLVGEVAGASSVPARAPIVPPPRRPAVSAPTPRTRSATKSAEDRLNWFQDDKRSARSPAPKSGL